MPRVGRARGLARDAVHPGYFYGALAVGLLAFTVRENAIVAPLAVSVATIWVASRHPRSRLIPIVGAIVALVASAALFYVWRRSLPGFLNATARAPTLSRIGLAALESGQSVLLVGLLVSPAIVLADPRRLLRVAWSRSPRVALTAALVTGGAFTFALLRTGAAAVLIPGDYFLPNGTLGTAGLKGARPDLIPGSLLTALAIVGAFALLTAVCVTVAAVTSRVANAWHKPRTSPAADPPVVIVTLAAIGYAIGCVVPVVLGYTFLFDRYLIPIVPLVAILLLHSSGPIVAPSRRIRIAGCVVLAALAALGAAYGANSASFDGTKWRVATQAIALTGDPKLIDGGRIWNDYHAGKHIRHGLTRPCVVLRAQPRPGAGEAGIVGTGTVWGFTGTQIWIVAHQSRAC